jgi:hypothetical protein
MDGEHIIGWIFGVAMVAAIVVTIGVAMGWLPIELLGGAE